MPVFVPKERAERGFEALPAGRYEVVVEKCEAGYGPTGIPYVTWVLIVDDEPHAGSRLWHRTSLDEKAVAFADSGLWAVLDRLGIAESFEGKDLDFEDFIAELDVIASGLRVEVAVSIYEYQGRERNDCLGFFAVPIEGQQFNPETNRMERPSQEETAEAPAVDTPAASAGPSRTAGKATGGVPVRRPPSGNTGARPPF